MNDKKNRRVLVIDDNRAIHEDFRKILQPGATDPTLDEVSAALLGDASTACVAAERFEIDSAYQGQEGLARVEEAVREGRPYAMAFVDGRMPPGWDGLETALHIWQVDPKIVIVFCTAYSDYSWSQLAEAVGDTGRFLLLKKPFENLEVLQLAAFLTDRLWTVEKLQESEEKFRTISDSALDAVIMMDPAGNVAHWNPAATKMFGYSREEIIGRGVHGTLAPARYRERTSEALAHFARTGQGPAVGKTLELQALRKDGTEFPVEIAVSSIQLEGQWWAVATVRDITQRKLAEEELNKHREHLEELVQDRTAELARANEELEQANEKLEREIAERWRAEEQMAIFGRFSEACGQGFGMADLNARITYVNPTLCRLIGENRPEDALGKSFTSYYPEEFRQKLEEEIIPTVIRQGQWVGELALLTSEGVLTPTLENFFLIRDEKENPLYLANVVTDITERKQAEQALRQSEQRYRRATSAVTDYIFSVRIEGGQPVETTHSPNSVAVTGYTPEEFAADPALWIRMVPEDDRDVVREQASRILSGGSPEPVEHRIVRKDGLVRWVRNTPAPHYDAQGKLVSYDGLIGDITERSQAEEELRRTTSALNSILASSTEYAIVAADLDFRITHYNPAAERLFGYQAQEVIGRTVREIHSREGVAPERFDQAIEAVIRDGKWEYQAESKSPDGRKRFLESTVMPMRDEAGECVGYVLFSHDITQHKLAEVELANAKEAAEAANRVKGEFLANMSHEIRTPMTAILGFTDVLAENLQEPENLQAAETIKRNGEYLLQVINEILDLSKIEVGKLDMERTECSPCRIVADVASLMKVGANVKGLELKVEYEGPLPETVQTDPTRLRQILINLVGNAIKFTETGSVRIVVRLVKSELERPMLRFDVIDTGIGITPQQTGKLFDPFAQSDSSTTRKFQGAGLGLAISKRLAEMLGGTIEVVSSDEKGSTFSATVETGPLDDVQMLDRPAEALPDSPQQSPAAATGKTKLDCRILLVEDGPDNQRLISFLLRKAGAEVTIAENGKVGVEKALGSVAGRGRRFDDEQEPFDLILMDMQMPVMDGYEATERLRREGYTGPIIALTAHAMVQDRRKCLDIGCDDYMSKPIDRGRLLNTVRKHLKPQRRQVETTATAKKEERE